MKTRVKTPSRAETDGAGLPETVPANAAALRTALEGLRRRLDQLLQKSGVPEEYCAAFHELLTDTSGVPALALDLIEELERKVQKVESNHAAISVQQGEAAPKPKREKPQRKLPKAVDHVAQPPSSGGIVPQAPPPAPPVTLASLQERLARLQSKK